VRHSERLEDIVRNYILVAAADDGFQGQAEQCIGIVGVGWSCRCREDWIAAVDGLDDDWSIVSSKTLIRRSARECYHLESTQAYVPANSSREERSYSTAVGSRIWSKRDWDRL
jgi:hypothetical protein